MAPGCGVGPPTTGGPRPEVYAGAPGNNGYFDLRGATNGNCGVIILGDDCEESDYRWFESGH